MEAGQFSENLRHLALRMAARSMNLHEIEAYRIIAEIKMHKKEERPGIPGIAQKWYALWKINEFFDEQKHIYREAFDTIAFAGVKPVKILDLFGQSGLGTAAIAERYPDAEVVCHQDNQRHKIAEVSGIFFQGRRVYGPLDKENFDTVFAIGRSLIKENNLVEAELFLKLAMKQTDCLCFVIDGFQEESVLVEFHKITETLGWEHISGLQGVVVLQRQPPKPKAKKKVT